MEIQLSFLSSFGAFLLFAFILLKLKNRYRFASRLPPGPWKLPLIGSMHHLAGSPLIHHTLRKLAQKHGPIIHLQLGQVSTVVVSSLETAKEVLKTYDINFASRPQNLVAKLIFYESTDIAFAPYGEYWKRLRKICTVELLSTKRVQSFRSIREEEVKNFITSIASNTRSPVNLTEKIFSNAFATTARSAFGKRSDDQEEYISFIVEAQKHLAGFNIADFYPSIKLLERISGLKSKLEKLREREDRILGNIINEHKERHNSPSKHEAQANEDLLDVLLAYNDEKSDFRLSINDIKAVTQDIFSAGSDTTATTIDWAMSEMMKNPHTMRMAQEEVRRVFHTRRNVDEANIHDLKYLKLVIKEALRLHPPGPLLFPRVCREKCEINGYEIPEMTNVFVNVWAIGRDPKYWNDAECFKPERFLDSSIDYRGNDFQYLPFGSGRRMCPGMTFGMASVELPLANLLYHFDWELANGIKPEELDMTDDTGASVRRKEDLYVIPVAYQPLVAEP